MQSCCQDVWGGNGALGALLFQDNANTAFIQSFSGLEKVSQQVPVRIVAIAPPFL
jgi:hypothetical protein